MMDLGELQSSFRIGEMAQESAVRISQEIGEYFPCWSHRTCMTMLAVLPLPGTADQHEGRILWFSAECCVQWSGDVASAEVFVASTLILRFTLRERGAPAHRPRT